MDVRYWTPAGNRCARDIVNQLRDERTNAECDADELVWYYVPSLCTGFDRKSDRYWGQRRYFSARVAKIQFHSFSDPAIDHPVIVVKGVSHLLCTLGKLERILKRKVRRVWGSIVKGGRITRGREDMAITESTPHASRLEAIGCLQTYLTRKDKVSNLESGCPTAVAEKFMCVHCGCRYPDGVWYYAKFCGFCNERTQPYGHLIIGEGPIVDLLLMAIGGLEVTTPMTHEVFAGTMVELLNMGEHM